ncbi:MAG TPA: DUF4260 family protein [Candidatus Dormibacteraeota bacterium]
MKKVAYLLLGVVSTGLAVAAVVTRSSSWLLLIVFAIAPDLSLLGGVGPGLERGQIRPSAVPFYNAVHRFWAPAVLTAVALLVAPAWLAAGLAWIAHIAFDRSLGFGLRSPEGFQRGTSRLSPAASGDRGRS